MDKRIAINGFGRIGRLAFRHIMETDQITVAAINDIVPLDNLVYLLRHDSVHTDPNPEMEILAEEDHLIWGKNRVLYLNKRDPAQLPWEELEVDLVIEASGIFTRREDAARHLEAGAKRVIVSAPGKGVDLTVCMGVNEDQYNPKHHQVISNASCTTNCLAPVAMIIDRTFNIETGFLTTVHAYTSSQAIVDSPSKKWRRGRAGAVSIVPTTTGAAIATTEVLPHLEGKLDGLAMRVPVPVGSIIDFVAHTEKPVTVESVNRAFREASRESRLLGVLGITDEELVSADIVGSEYSAIVDAQSTMVLGENTVKVLAWYDNEWGYAKRVVDLVGYVLQQNEVE